MQATAIVCLRYEINDNLAASGAALQRAKEPLHPPTVSYDTLSVDRIHHDCTNVNGEDDSFSAPCVFTNVSCYDIITISFGVMHERIYDFLFITHKAEIGYGREFYAGSGKHPQLQASESDGTEISV